MKNIEIEIIVKDVRVNKLFSGRRSHCGERIVLQFLFFLFWILSFRSSLTQKLVTEWC